MTKLKKTTITLLFLIPIICNTQNTIEPYIGYGIDVANKPSFSQANIGLQYSVINHRVYRLFLRVQGGLPLGAHPGNDMAFTPDQSLPLSITTDYKTKWYSGALIIGNKFKMISWAGKNSI